MSNKKRTPINLGFNATEPYTSNTTPMEVTNSSSSIGSSSSSSTTTTTTTTNTGNMITPDEGTMTEEEMLRLAPPVEDQPILQNIVSTVNLGCSLDLKTIALKARNAEYNPKRFAAVIMRIRDPKTTALIFASGKMVCTGAKNPEMSKLAARKYARIIQKLEFPVRFQDFKIQNIVASVDAKFPIRLEQFSMKHTNYCSYEPELFPGLIYRMIEPRVVLLIFVSGKIVFTGSKTKEDIYTAYKKIYPTICQFKK
mmetsp:Transcript_15159/g.22703  ORF Transcript_15159/g.22703 Transcript_15159/m.22703 type:complete len:254 (-) Transcript_15159:103-864(-)